MDKVSSGHRSTPRLLCDPHGSYICLVDCKRKYIESVSGLTFLSLATLSASLNCGKLSYLNLKSCHLFFLQISSTKFKRTQCTKYFKVSAKSVLVVYSGNTPPDASFTGSMQLLAGVKLCTDRHITNHPHYENKFLRERTKQVTMKIPLYLPSYSFSHKRSHCSVGGEGERKWGSGVGVKCAVVPQ